MDSVNMKDIARMCEVSVSTVSRAINNHPDINPETREMIMKAIGERGYIPNNSARNLKRTDSRDIAVLIKGLDNPFFGKMIRIFEDELMRRQYSLIIQRVEPEEDEVDAALELLKERKPRGLVFLGGFLSHSREKPERLTAPFVLSTIGTMGLFKDSPTPAWVSVDDYAESYKLTDYLCKLGHRKILILAASEEDESIGRLRLEGYQKALSDHGIKPNRELCVFSEAGGDCYTMDYGFQAMNRILKGRKLDFTAVYGISDSIAIGALKSLLDHGKRIPEEYSVAGFDGLDVARYYNPALTTMRQPVEEMAFATISLLFDMIEKKAGPRKRVFQAELVVGQSTAPPGKLKGGKKKK